MSKLIIIVGVIFSIISCSKSITFDQDVQKATLKRVNENIVFDEQTQRFIFVKKSKSADIYGDEEAVINANLYLDSLTSAAENNGEVIGLIKYYALGPEDIELDSTDMDNPIDSTIISPPYVMGTLTKYMSHNVDFPSIPPYTKYSSSFRVTRTPNTPLTETVLHVFTVSTKSTPFNFFTDYYEDVSGNVPAGKNVRLQYYNFNTNSSIIWTCFYTFKGVI